MDNSSFSSSSAIPSNLPPASSVAAAAAAAVTIVAAASAAVATESSPDEKGGDETILVAVNNDPSSSSMEWTAATVVQSIVLFGLAGVAEIVGGWMVWVAIRGSSGSGSASASASDNTHENNKKPWWYAVLGSILLIVYGFIPCLQPMDSFGRIYAAYGGFFIVLSFVFGWVLDGDRPDLGDVVGGSISLVGVLLILFWPR